MHVPCLLRSPVVFASATVMITHGCAIPMQTILCYRSIGFAWKCVWGTASRACFLPPLSAWCYLHDGFHISAICLWKAQDSESAVESGEWASSGGEEARRDRVQGVWCRQWAAAAAAPGSGSFPLFLRDCRPFGNAKVLCQVFNSACLSRKQLRVSKHRQLSGAAFISHPFEEDEHFLSFDPALLSHSLSRGVFCFFFFSTELDDHLIVGLLSVGVLCLLIVLVYGQGQRQYFRTKIRVCS